MSKGSKSLREKCKEYGIKCRLYEFVNGDAKWFNEGGIDVKPGSDEEKNARFQRCMFNGCLTLEDGEMAYCSRATNSYRVQGFRRDENDYLIVDGRKGFYKEMHKYLGNKHAMEACRFCYGTDSKNMIEPAIQLKR